MKKIFTSVVVLMLISCFAISICAMTFTDVPENAWYYEDVDNAVRLGIINGKSGDTFAPNDNLTYAEAIKLAACMHQLYDMGTVHLVSVGSPWYQTYVDYCVKNGIITKERAEVYSYNEKATRAGYMEIFANALPDEALKVINNVPDDSIPDVPSSKAYAEGVYKLYRAGILQGVDAEHNCKPLDNIKRSEVAAIITRMMNERMRVSFGMGEEEKPEEKTEEPKEEPKGEVKEEPKETPVETPEEKPEVKEEQSDEPIEDDSETVESVDMYPELIIASQPEYVHRNPTHISGTQETEDTVISPLKKTNL